MSVAAEKLAAEIAALRDRLSALERGAQLARSSVRVGDEDVLVPVGIGQGVEAKVQADQLTLDLAAANSELTVLQTDLGTLDATLATAQTDIDAAEVAVIAAQADADAAGTSASAAQADATQALTDADSALSTANGKNKIIFSTSDASGTAYATGDIWFKKSGSLVVGQWEFVSGAWAARTLDSAVIANLNAAKITAGTLNAARIAAGTLTADKLTIADFTNQVREPDFNLGGIEWTGTFTTLAASATEVPVGAPRPFVARDNSRDMVNLGYFGAAASDQFYVEGWAACGTSTYAFGIGLQTVDAAGANPAWSVASGGSGYIPAGTTTWTKFWGYVTVPAGKYQARPWMQINGPSGSQGIWYVTGVRIFKRASGELIVDGAITAAKIGAGQVTAGKLAADSVVAVNIKAGEVVAGKLAANAVVAANIAAGEVVAGKLGADAVVANNIAAGQITTTKLAADAIDGKIITGATVRTAASGQRVELNAAGLKGYDAAGVVKTSVSTAGALNAVDASLQGDLTTGAFGDRVIVSNDSVRFMAAVSPSAEVGRAIYATPSGTDVILHLSLGAMVYKYNLPEGGSAEVLDVDHLRVGRAETRDGKPLNPPRLGEFAEVVTDFNLVEYSGWSMGQNVANAPSSAWHLVETLRHNSIWAIQTAYTFTSNPALTYRRQEVNGTWSAWRELGQTGVGGTPYKMAAGAFSMSTFTQTVSLPPGRFTVPPIVTPSFNGGNRHWVAADSVTTTSFRFLIWNGSGSGGPSPSPIDVSWTAIQMTSTSGAG